MFWRRKHSKTLDKEIEALFPRLWRYCLVLTGSNDDGADLAQSVCLRALEQYNISHNDTPLDRWAFRVAKNSWYNTLRAQRIREGKGVFSVEDIALVSNEVEPEQRAMHQDIIRSVLALPEAQRLVVNLVYIEGYRYQETADILEIPIGTVMSRLAAARTQLSTKLVAFKGQA